MTAASLSEGARARARQDRARRFLAAAGWGGAHIAPLAGDASARRYHRLTDARGRTAVLMDADPGAGEDVRPFLAVAAHLAGAGFSAPAVLAEDAEAGFLLLEDLGDDLYARVLARRPELEVELYAAATDVLAALHALPLPAWADGYGAVPMGDRAALAVEWYLPGLTGGRPGAASADRAAFAAAVTEAVGRLAPGTPVLALRDYHAENLLWLPGRRGTARVGLLDFQDAAAAHPAYDLVSLIEDARRDVGPATAAGMRARYAAATGADPEALDTAGAALAAQRNLRILGVFARLCLRDGKPGYAALLPRVWAHLQRDLAHPGLAALRAAASVLPAPEPARLARLAARCGRFRTR